MPSRPKPRIHRTVIIVLLILAAHNLSAQNHYIGVSAAGYYTFKTAHAAPAVTYTYKRHNLYAGPDFVSLLGPIADEAVIYRNSASGIQFGYGYDLYRSERLAVFFRMHFSVYNYRTIATYHSGPQEQSNTITESSGMFGVSYSFGKHFKAFAGAGGNSFSGFFLIFENYRAIGFAGLSYSLPLSKNRK